jgi:exonuclease SbcC
MKITIAGFRCYKLPTTFEFHDKGIILISGQSGIGKSTILMAINFALYGHGRNICSYGETKCKVELTFKDIKITRTKSPNRLVVNDIYEDTVAQQLIFNLFGKSFDVTGYIPQNTTESFLNKNAVAKREFLESVDTELSLLPKKYEKIDAVIKQNKQDLDRTLGRLEEAKKYLPAKPDEVKLPKKTSDIEQYIKNSRVKVKNNEINMNKIKREISKVETKLNELKVATTYISGKDENIAQITAQIASLSLDLEKEQDYIGDEQLFAYQKQLTILKNNSQLQRLILQKNADELKLKNMEDTETHELTRNSESIKSQLWQDYSKEEALSFIESNQEVLKDIQTISALKAKKKTLKDLTILQSQRDELLETLEKIKIDIQTINVLSCPSCDTNLLLKNNNLIVSDYSKSNSTKSLDELRNQSQLLTSQLQKLEYEIIKQDENKTLNDELDVKIYEILSAYDDQEMDEAELRGDLKEMEAYYSSQIALEKKWNENQNRITNKLFSPSYQSCRKDLEKLVVQIKKLEENSNNEPLSNYDKDEDFLRDIIQNHQHKGKKIQDIENRIFSQEQIKNKLVTQKEEYVAKLGVSDDENVLKSSLMSLKTDLKNLEAKSEQDLQNLKQVEDFVLFKKEEALYLSHLDNIAGIENQQDIDSNRYTQSKIFKSDLLEREHIALTKTISHINANANIFLQDFFDEAIFVNLLCFKEDKKKSEKPFINIEVKYRNQNCLLSSLSGGEYARVNLAFTLALALIFKTPLLLLDETLSSLDEIASENVFTSIKKHFKDIPVISILHQVTSEGDFDQVIKL